MKPIYQAAAVALGVAILAGCGATKLKNVKKDASYDPRSMKRVFVAAVVKSRRVQKMVEDEFVRQLQDSGRDAVASYTVVARDAQLQPEEWKKLIRDHQCDSVVLTRLTHLDSKENDMEAKVNLPTQGTGYSYTYYATSYAAAYTPATYVRDETAYLETKVFDTATEREVWSVQSETELTWGGDPEPQIRKFVSLLIREAKR